MDSTGKSRGTGGEVRKKPVEEWNFEKNCNDKVAGGKGTLDSN